MLDPLLWSNQFLSDPNWWVGVHVEGLSELSLACCVVYTLVCVCVRACVRACVHT